MKQPPRATIDKPATASQSARFRQPLNKLLEGTDVLLIKSDDPKILYSVRSKSSAVLARPHTNTISGERARQLLQSEELRPETSATRRRIESSAEFHQSKQFSKEYRADKHRLKELLGRIGLLKEGGDLCVARPIQTIFELLNMLGRTENFHRGAFQYVDETLRAETLFAKDRFDCEKLKTIIQATNNRELVRALYSTDGVAVSYREICSELAREFVGFIHKTEAEKLTYEQYVAELNRTIDEKRETLRKMKETVKYYSFHPSQDLYPYIEELEQRVQQLKEEAALAQRLSAQTLSNYEILKTTNGILDDKIQQLRAKNYELELAKFTSTDAADKNSELVEFEEHVGTLKAMLDKSLLRMVGMKEEFDKLRQHNQTLIGERSELAKRAAVGFGELTPRPNLKRIFQEEGLEFERIFKATDKKVSTQNFVRTVVGRFKETFQSLKELELGKKIVLDSRGIPLNKFKQKPEPSEILEELRRGKEKLKLTEAAAFNVKNRYNKQIEEKRKIQNALHRN